MQKIIEKFKGRGFKLTPQRIAILKFLEGNTNHPTAEDIFLEIRKNHPTVSFATVYNTVQTLKKMGEILEITIDPERKHFDPNPNPHHHIICTACNRIGDIFVDYSESLKLPADVLEEYSTSGNHIDFYGVCRDCQIKQ
ncbi:MAG: transcriptional repressor [Deltaproteobacteria bacterium]|nr:transcriptional repressor [Deltaproteobacteria bacterium]